MDHVWTSVEDAIGQNMTAPMEQTNLIVVNRSYTGFYTGVLITKLMLPKTSLFVVMQSHL